MAQEVLRNIQNMEGLFGIAVDIGTTTIVAGITDEKGAVRQTASRANSGAAFGADVMSRIRAATEGHAAELRERLRSDITGVIAALTGSSGIPPRIIVLAGNTTMLHLLNGYDCAGLGKYPYTPVSLAAEERVAGELFSDLPEAWRSVKVIELPGISAFVGADIVSGLYALDAAHLPAGQTALFLDLGTNGEMALIEHVEINGSFNKVRITVCSTAAGPVFEGAGIHDGMRGEAGAISSVLLVPGGSAPTNDRRAEDHSLDPTSPDIRGAEDHALNSRFTPRCRTIGNVPPTGICGSGVLEAVSELARLHIIDHDGLLSEPWFSEGFPLARRGETASFGDTWIRLYQEDIRAVQLAKAAIRAGTQTLLTSRGLPRDAVNTAWIAGAFGGALTFSRLGPLGIFSPDLLPVCRSVGNTSLKGAAKAAAAFLRGEGDQTLTCLQQLCDAAEELLLAGRQDFEALYLSSMAL